jgi:hypothetical protein
VCGWTHAALRSVVQLLRVCQGQQDMTGQLIAAVCSAVRSSTAVWQASGLPQLLDALYVLKGTAAARHAVLAAAVEGLFQTDGSSNSNNIRFLLSSQTDDSMLQLLQLLLSEPQLAAAYYGRFAAAVAVRKANYPLLKQLLQAESVLAALDSADAQHLVACQVANLEKMSVVPAFTWCMPKAKMPSHPKVSSSSSSMSAVPAQLAALAVKRVAVYAIPNICSRCSTHMADWALHCCRWRRSCTAPQRHSHWEAFQASLAPAERHQSYRANLSTDRQQQNQQQHTQHLQHDCYSAGHW